MTIPSKNNNVNCFKELPFLMYLLKNEKLNA